MRAVIDGVQDFKSILFFVSIVEAAGIITTEFH